MSEYAAPSKHSKDTVVLHLTESDDIRDSSFLPHRRDDFCQFCHFLPAAVRCPSALACGQELLILKALIVHGVEEVLHIPLHDTQRPRPTIVARRKRLPLIHGRGRLAGAHEEQQQKKKREQPIHDKESNYEIEGAT